MGWLIFVLCLLLLLLMPLKLFVRYNGNLRAWLTFGPVTINLYPKKRSPGKKRASQKKNGFESHEEVKKQKKSDKESVVAIIKLILDFLNDFRTKLRIDDLQLRIILADEDPCDLSVNYGRSWAALGSFYPQLERFFVIKKRQVEIECDYTAEETVINASADLTITVGRILTLGVYHGFKLLRKYLTFMKKSKDGAVS